MTIDGQGVQTVATAAQCPVGADVDRAGAPLSPFHRVGPGPVRPAEASENPDGAADWMVTRYRDVVAALADPRLSSGKVEVSGCPRARADEAATYGASEATVNKIMSKIMVVKDPPEHTRLRKLVVREFSAKRIDAFRPRVQQIADELLDTIAERDEVDIMKTFAFPLPVRTISELLGVPDEIAQRLLPPEDERDAARGIPLDTLHAAAHDWVEVRRKAPIDDLVSHLVVAHDDGELSYEELVAMPFLLILGGFISTTQLIGGGLVTLLDHPEQLAQVRRDPTLASAMVDEVLRYA